MSDREDRIRQRAYEKWQKEGEAHGWHDRHWAEAEAELEAEDKSAKPAAEKATTTRKKTVKSKPQAKSGSGVSTKNIIKGSEEETVLTTSKPAAAPKKSATAGVKKTIVRKTSKTS